MVSKLWRMLVVSVCLVSFVFLGTAFAQKDVKFEGGKEGAVIFVHKAHVAGQKLKCADCHDKVFTKKREAKITKESHGEKKFCAVCHDGKKAFSMTTEADCAKCHKK